MRLLYYYYTGIVYRRKKKMLYKERLVLLIERDLEDEIEELDEEREDDRRMANLNRGWSNSFIDKYEESFNLDGDIELIEFKGCMLLIYKRIEEHDYIPNARRYNYYVLNLKTMRPTKNSKIQKRLSQEAIDFILLKLGKYTMTATN